MPRTRTAALLVLIAVTTAGAGGCGGRERVCRSGEYPVRAVDTRGGLACISEGEEPPAGYERFPEGEVPEFVDDVYPE